MFTQTHTHMYTRTHTHIQTYKHTHAYKDINTGTLKLRDMGGVWVK